MAKDMDKSAIEFRKYMTKSPREDSWGLFVTGVGIRNISPYSDYYDDEQPAPYRWTEGRRLDEFGLVYLVGGKGVFESRETGARAVKEGNLISLFPGVWHNYHPTIDTGWHEYWILFAGDQPARFEQNGILDPNNPILDPGLDERLHHLFSQIFDLVETEPIGAGLLRSAIVGQLIAQALMRHEERKVMGRKSSSVIQTAKCYLEEHRDGQVEMAKLAESLHLSYRQFRRLFRDATGLAPQQYHTQLRINRAKELIELSDLRINEIADLLGFEDPFYFSRLFTKKTGRSPSDWRRLRQQSTPT